MVMLLSPDRCASRGTERKLVSVRFQHRRARPEATFAREAGLDGSRTRREAALAGNRIRTGSKSPETRDLRLCMKSPEARDLRLCIKNPETTHTAALHRKPQGHIPGKIRMHRDPPAHLYHDPALWADIVIEISCFLMV